MDYEEQDDLVDFDDRMTQASESDKVRAHHDISQHQSWLESPFDKLKISDQKGRMPVVMFISISKYEIRGNRCTAKRSDSEKTPTNTRHPVTSTVHTGAPHEPIFYPRITSTVGLTTRKRRSLSRRNVTLNRPDLPRSQYPNPVDQAMPKHQTQHSEPVNTTVTQFQPQANLQFQSPIVQNPLQSRVTPPFSLPSNLQSTLQGPDNSNVNISRNFNKQTLSAPIIAQM